LGWTSAEQLSIGVGYRSNKFAKGRGMLADSFYISLCSRSEWARCNQYIPNSQSAKKLTKRPLIGEQAFHLWRQRFHLVANKGIFRALRVDTPYTVSVEHKDNPAVFNRLVHRVIHDNSYIEVIVASYA
jgi:hypothetical protein